MTDGNDGVVAHETVGCHVVVVVVVLVPGIVVVGGMVYRGGWLLVETAGAPVISVGETRVGALVVGVMV